MKLNLCRMRSAAEVRWSVSLAQSKRTLDRLLSVCETATGSAKVERWVLLCWKTGGGGGLGRWPVRWMLSARYDYDGGVPLWVRYAGRTDGTWSALQPTTSEDHGGAGLGLISLPSGLQRTDVQRIIEALPRTGETSLRAPLLCFISLSVLLPAFRADP